MGIRTVIAESGSSKTDWRLLEEDGKIISFTTTGLNPFYQSIEEIDLVLGNSPLPEISPAIDKLFFYGAGCLSGVAHEKMRAALGQLVAIEKVRVSDDLMAAARACLRNQAGIACILGTGSNSCFYDGTDIIRQIPAMGFILGDEGSGAVMGRKLVNAYFKEDLPRDLKELFFSRYHLNLEDLLMRVYREPFPNRYLAGFTYFLAENQNHPWIYSFLKESLQEFIRKNVARYSDYRKYPVSFTGSVAGVFRNILEVILREEQITAGVIIEKPIDALVEYHTGFNPD
jgi:glucosamine kinase